MSSYKLPLIKALPMEMKYLAAYAYKIGAKLIVDGETVGYQKDFQDIHYVSSGEDALPPEGVVPFGSLIAVETADNLEAKKQGVKDVYQWSLKLDQNLFDTVQLITLEGEDIEIFVIAKSIED